MIVVMDEIIVEQKGEHLGGSSDGTLGGRTDGTTGGTTPAWRSPDGLTYAEMMKRTADAIRANFDPRHRFGGFMAYPAASVGNNVTKAAVLSALDDGWSNVGQLMASTGLSIGRVRGVVSRGCRYGFVRRSEYRLQLVPQGSAYVYGLTERGWAWLGWWRGS